MPRKSRKKLSEAESMARAIFAPMVPNRHDYARAYAQQQAEQREAEAAARQAAARDYRATDEGITRRARKAGSKAQAKRNTRGAPPAPKRPRPSRTVPMHELGDTARRTVRSQVSRARRADYDGPQIPGLRQAEARQVGGRRRYANPPRARAAPPPTDYALVVVSPSSTALAMPKTSTPQRGPGGRFLPLARRASPAPLVRRAAATSRALSKAEAGGKTLLRMERINAQQSKELRDLNQKINRLENKGGKRKGKGKGKIAKPKAPTTTPNKSKGKGGKRGNRRSLTLRYGTLTAPRALMLGAGAVAGAGLVGGASWLVQYASGSPMVGAIAQLGAVGAALLLAMAAPNPTTAGLFVGALASTVTANAKRALDWLTGDAMPTPAPAPAPDGGVAGVGNADALARMIDAPVRRILARVPMAKSPNEPGVAEPGQGVAGMVQPKQNIPDVGRMLPYQPVMTGVGASMANDPAAYGIGAASSGDDAYAALQKSLGG